VLAHHLLGMPELKRQLLIVALLDDPRANGVSLRAGKLLKQRKCALAHTHQLLHPQEILIVKRERRHPQTLSRFDLHASASGALAQLVSRYTKQPRQRRRLARPVAPAHQQRGGESLASEIRCDLLRAHPTRNERQNLGDMTTIEDRESRAIAHTARQQQLIVVPRIIV